MSGYERAFGTLIVAIAVGALAAPTAASAQLRFGVRAGANFATVTGDDADGDDVDTRTGLVAGGFVEAPLADIIGLQVGALYSQKGFKPDVIGSSAAIKIDYLDVPALLVVTVPATESVGVGLYLGPTFSFRVKCEGTFAGFSGDCDDQGIETFDLGGEVGAGLRFGMGRSTFLLDGFYNFGLGSIDDDPSDPLDIKNQVFSVSAGLIFPVGG